jgi:hypothetical protein
MKASSTDWVATSWRPFSTEIDNLKSYAGIHPIVFGYHRLLSRRFPYAIYYSIDANAVIVKAVLDCRRDPAWIIDRLK